MYNRGTSFGKSIRATSKNPESNLVTSTCCIFLNMLVVPWPTYLVQQEQPLIPYFVLSPFLTKDAIVSFQLVTSCKLHSLPDLKRRSCTHGLQENVSCSRKKGMHFLAQYDVHLDLLPRSIKKNTSHLHGKDITQDGVSTLTTMERDKTLLVTWIDVSLSMLPCMVADVVLWEVCDALRLKRTLYSCNFHHQLQAFWL